MGSARAEVNAGRLLEQLPVPDRLKDSAEDPVTEKPSPAEIPLPQKGEVGVRLRGFRLVGDNLRIPPDRWQELQNLVVNRDLGFTGLQMVADRVAAAARDLGYPLAQALLPEQDLSDRLLRIELNLGRLDDPPFELRDQQTALRTGIATDILNRYLKPNQILEEQALNEALLRLNMLSGVRAQASFLPGELPGSSRLLVDLAADADPWSLQAGLSNAGNITTGRDVLNLDLQGENTWQLGEQVGLNVNKSRGLSVLGLTGSLPWGSTGGRLGLGGTWLIYKSITSDPATQGLRGKSAGLSISWTAPLLRQIERSADWYASFDTNRMRDENRVGADLIRLSDKSTSALTLGISGQRRMAWGQGADINGSISWKSGRLRLPDSEEVTNNLERDQTVGSGLFTQGSYQKASWSAGWLQFIRKDFLVNLSARGQQALGNKNLDSSEKMSLGGVRGVRAYPSGEASGDRGQLLQLELDYTLPWRGPSGQRLNLITFYDKGWIRFYTNPTVAGRADIASNDQQRSKYSLAGYGLTLRLFRANQYSLDITWARKDGSNPGSVLQGLDSDGKEDSQRWWLSGQVRF